MESGGDLLEALVGIFSKSGLVFLRFWSGRSRWWWWRSGNERNNRTTQRCRIFCAAYAAFLLHMPHFCAAYAAFRIFLNLKKCGILS
jgi:hypothetical protein